LIGVAAAENHYDLYLVAPANHKGRVWSMSLDPDFTGVPVFNGKDIVKSSIVVYWSNSFTGTEGYLTPTAIVSHHLSVEFHFDKNDLPAEGADFNYITGTLKNGDTFIATGAGFTYGHV